MAHAIFKPRVKRVTSITTIATTLALTLTPAQAVAGGQAANNTVSEVIDTLKASLVNVFGGQAGLLDQSVKETTNRPFVRGSAGSDRHHTAWEIVGSVFKSKFDPQSRVVKKIHVVSGDDPTDTFTASNLKDGTLLLAPPEPNDNIAAHEQTTYRGKPHFTDEDHEAAQQGMLRPADNARTKTGLSPVTISPTAVKFANNYARNPLERHSTQEERSQCSPDIWGKDLLFGNAESSDRNPLKRNIDVCIKDSRASILDETRDAFTKWWNSKGHRNAIVCPKSAPIGFGYRLDYRVARSHSEYALAFVKKPASVGSRSERTIPEKKSGSSPTKVEFTTTRNGRHDYEMQLVEHQQKVCKVCQRSGRLIPVKVLGGDPELVCARFGIKYDRISDTSGISSSSVRLRDDLPRQDGESSWVYYNPEFAENRPPGVSTVKPEWERICSVWQYRTCELRRGIGKPQRNHRACSWARVGEYSREATVLEASLQSLT